MKLSKALVSVAVASLFSFGSAMANESTCGTHKQADCKKDKACHWDAKTSACEAKAGKAEAKKEVKPATTEAQTTAPAATTPAATTEKTTTPAE